MIGRESPPIFLQLECRGLCGSTLGVHARLMGQAVALQQVAALAGGDDIGPGRPPAARARHHMIEGQLMCGAAAPAILAGEAVPEEDVEPGEGRPPVQRHESFNAMTLGSRISKLGLRTMRWYWETILTRSRKTALIDSCQGQRD